MVEHILEDKVRQVDIPGPVVVKEIDRFTEPSEVNVILTNIRNIAALWTALFELLRRAAAFGCNGGALRVHFCLFFWPKKITGVKKILA